MTLPMQKATYRALATSAPIKFGKSKNGNVQIAVEFEILDKNEADEDVSTGEYITWIGHFTDKTANRTIESLQHAGWQGDDPSDLNGVSASSELLTPVELVCEPEEWEGALTLKVQWVNKPGAGRFAFKEPISDNELKAFGAQLRANVKAVRAAGGDPRAPRQQSATSRSSGSSGAPRHPNAPGADDDIPF